MSIYITGDTHGTFDLRKVVYFFKGREEEFSRDDYLIICGDVGVCGFMASDEAKTRDILRNLPVTVLFVDGNHENFEQLNSYAVEIWNGGKVSAGTCLYSRAGQMETGPIPSDGRSVV